ncbi:Glycosyl transferases group 1 [Leishmania braziliensis]|nr:Glycosyl transferases group 1 [Leishmania braziliensis]
MWTVYHRNTRRQTAEAGNSGKEASKSLDLSPLRLCTSARVLVGRPRALLRLRAIAVLLLVVPLILLTGLYHVTINDEVYLNEAEQPPLPEAKALEVLHKSDVHVSLIMPLLIEGNASALAPDSASLADLLGPLMQSEEALCYHSGDHSTQALVNPVHAVVISRTAAASPALAAAIRSVLPDGVSQSGDVLPQGTPFGKLTPAQSWRAWELSTDAVRAALRGATNGTALCFGDRLTLVAPVASLPDTTLEVLVDTALRTRGGRTGSHFVVLPSFLGATRMPYTEPGDALETRHEGTGLLDALVRTATQRNGGRVAAAQCTILQHSGNSSGWHYPLPRLTTDELSSLRVVDKGGLTGTTHNGGVLLPYLTRRLSGYSAADQRASWEEVVDAVSLHCSIFSRRLYDAVGGLAGALSSPAVTDTVSVLEDHAMGAADRGGWALSLRMQQVYPAWQVWGSRAAAVVHNDVDGVRELPSVVSLQRPLFSLLDRYGHSQYNVLTELQRRRMGVPWRLRGEDPQRSEKWTTAEQKCLPPVMRYHMDFPAPCIGLNLEAMAYIRPLMERYGIGVIGNHRPCPKSGDALLQLAYGRVSDLFKSVPAEATQMFFRARLRERATLVFQHARAYHFLPLTERHPREPPRVYIGHSMSELSNIRQNWIVPMQTRTDEVWTTADFFATIYRRNGVNPAKIRVVPEPVDVYEYDPANYVRQPAMYSCPDISSCDNRPNLTREERLQRYVFFSNFKWEDRKGWDVLLKAYWDAFGLSAPPELRERTTLVIKTRITQTYSPYLSKYSILHFIETWGRSGALPGLRSIADFPHIVVVEGKLSGTEIAQMYANADAFVYPTKAEGWGLPAAEAMAMGLPVLITEWSGPLRMMERDSCFRIPVDGLEEILPNSPYGYAEGMKMAMPSVEKTAELMQYVVKHPEHAQRVGHRAREYAVRELSEEAVADRMDRLFVRSVIRKLRG